MAFDLTKTGVDGFGKSVDNKVKETTSTILPSKFNHLSVLAEHEG